ncbi:YveK family protein [Sutcliffiella deserti]|uniref:YveK family protein n=1 Tax=Sutcliffiella deserti TaxID=2875501 RepID=UPI001CC0ECB5|nr:Wzz/FepE/Etk N-terminal domain-containing protein [Sutcliffiella deserti]
MDDRMNLKNFIQVLKRRFKTILVTILCLFILTSLTSIFIIKPTYESTSTILVGKLEREVAAQGEINMLLASTMDLLKSPIVLNEVKKEMNITTDLEKEVSLQNNKNSQIINVIVRDHDPEIAKEIASSISSTAVTFMKESFNVADIQVLNATEIEPEVIGSLTLNLGIGFVVSAFLGVGMAMLREDLDDGIKHSKEVEEIIGIPVLGTINLKQKMRIPLVVGERGQTRKVGKSKSRGELRV